VISQEGQPASSLLLLSAGMLGLLGFSLKKAAA
jgi:hypothetical protein